MAINATYLTKLRLGSIRYTQTDITEVFVPLCMIINPKLNVSPAIVFTVFL